MGGAETSADGNIETFQFVLFDDGDQPQIVGKYVDIIIRRDGNADLEFAGEVAVLIERIFFFLLVRELFLVEPDLIIGRRFWQQQLADAGRIGVHLFVDRRLSGMGGAGDIPVDITAGGRSNRGQAALKAEMVGLTRLFRIPCSCMVCRVVILMTPVEFSPAIWWMAIHCSGVKKPPGTRSRIINE